FLPRERPCPQAPRVFSLLPRAPTSSLPLLGRFAPQRFIQGNGKGRLAAEPRGSASTQKKGTHATRPVDKPGLQRQNRIPEGTAEGGSRRSREGGRSPP